MTIPFPEFCKNVSRNALLIPLREIVKPLDRLKAQRPRTGRVPEISPENLWEE